MARLFPRTSKTNERVIAALAVRFASEAVGYFENVDESDLRIQIAAALLKATMLPAIRDKFFEHGDGSLVDKLFADGRPIPEPDDTGWDLV